MDIKRPIIYQKRTQTSIVNRVVNKNAPDIILQSGTPYTTKSSYIQALVTKNFKNKLGRVAYVGLSAVFLLSLIIAIPPLQQSVNYYDLPSNIKSLVGDTDPELAKKLTFDPAKQTYQYNKQSDNAQAAAPPISQSIKASAGAENYALDMPVDPKVGLTTHDLKNDISIKLIPQFKLREGKNTDGRIVYPLLNSDAQLIYSPKGNGVKEDLVLPYKTKDEMSFSYRLELPKTLEARLLDNGDIGIYGGDASLFGNISYGSDEDRAKVELAREKSAKTNLLFAIPAPLIVESSPSPTPPSASFELSDNVLTVNAKGLQKANYPISIDPSVVVTSASDFTKGNQEGNIDFDTANNQVKRAGLTGGSVGSWTTDTATFATARFGHTTVVSNGYIYLSGGQNGSTLQNDVQYAKFGTSGALEANAGCGTAWCTTSSFTSGRTYHASFAFNGYIYIAGGYDSTFYSDVQYAKVGPSGALEANAGCGTAWCATSSFSTARFSHMTVVHNNYVYMLGGCSAVFGVFCNGYPNDVQYAPIKGDGSLGAWASTGTFPSPRQWAGMSVYNGYIYVSGGEFASTYYSDVYYAPINTDGTISSSNWATTAALPTTRIQHSMSVHQGYLYIHGGQASGAPQNDVLYAAINSSGKLGAWSTTNSFTSSRIFFSSVANDGYIYIIGGCSSIGVNCNLHYNDTQYATIDPAGVVGSFVASTAFTTARQANATVAYNGYLYVTGGFDVGALSDVQYAPINADGSVGTWNTTSALPTTRYLHSIVAYNGYIYLVGGYNGTFFNDVYYATLNTNGTVGTWNSTTSFTTGRFGHAAVAHNGYMYVMGGQSFGGVYNGDVQYAQINANGTVGTWNTTTALGTARTYHAAEVYSGYLYIFGGCSAGASSCNAGSFLNDVEYVQINANGTIGTWTATTSFTTARYSHKVVADKGFMYLFGGESSGPTLHDDVQYAPINSNGTIGSWTATSSFTTARKYHGGTMHRGFIYLTGGNSGSLQNDVQYAPINNGGKGTVTSWSTNANSFTTARYWHASTAHNGYIYVLGGTNGTTFNDVQYAPINSNGTIGTWTATTSFTTARYELTAHTYNGYLYILGGGNGSNTFNDVQYAPINSNGTIGAWTATTSFTTSRQDHASAIYNGYMYILGGANQGGAKLNDVQYAPINANGTIGTWTATSSFTTVRQGLASVAANGYIYILGGWTNASGTHYDDVQYAPINSNGTVGTWVSTAKMLGPRGNHASFISNGFVYVIGGCSSGGCATPANDVWYAPLNATGGLGAWQSSTALAALRTNHTGLAHNGYIYILGGFVSGASQNDILITGQEAIPRVAKYSFMFNCGGDCVATKLYYRGSIVNNSELKIGYKVAPNSSGIFGSMIDVLGLTSNTLKTINTTENQYYQLNFSIDDTQSAVFPDSAGTQGSLTDFEMFYHPASAKRLRGGKTFTNQQQQSFDAQP